MRYLLLCVVLLSGCITVQDDVETFELSHTITPEGSGSITPDEGGFEKLDLLSVQAIPNNGYVFFEWGGDLSGSDNPTSVELRSDITAEAIFNTYERSITYRYAGYNGWDGEVENASFDLMIYLPGTGEITGYTLLDENDNEVTDVDDINIIGEPVRYEDTIFCGIDFYNAEEFPLIENFKKYTIQLHISYKGERFTKTNNIMDKEDFLR